jgi:hypothetical protein
MAAAVATLGSTLVFHGSVPQYHQGTLFSILAEVSSSKLMQLSEGLCG